MFRIIVSASNTTYTQMHSTVHTDAYTSCVSRLQDGKLLVYFLVSFFNFLSLFLFPLKEVVCLFLHTYRTHSIQP